MIDICKEYEVNEEQASALDIDENTALRAGAGSGKTRVLTKRFVRLLLENLQVELGNIVAITFTRKAATEMKDRIRKELTSRMGKCVDSIGKKKLAQLRMLITTANIDTIHGFCGRLLRDNYTLLGIDPEFQVIEEVDAEMKLSEISEEIINNYMGLEENYEKLLKVISTYSTDVLTSDLKGSLIDVYKSFREKGISVLKLKSGTAIKDLDDSSSTEILEAIASELVAELDREYSEYKYNENLLDFNDLELLSHKLLQNEEVCKRYFGRYKCFLIDEFQDVNPLQKSILDRLVLENNNIPKGKLFLVGDHKQSIYGFRGADYRVFEEACKQISDCGEITPLSNCYRSTKNIINAVNGIFQHLLDPFERLNCPNTDKEDGAKVELITWEKQTLTESKSITRWEAVKKLYPDGNKVEEFKKALIDNYENTALVTKKDYQGDIIAGRITKLIEEGFQYKDVAILMRSRTSLKAIESALERSNIPFCVLGGLGFWERQEIIDILSLYRIVFQPDDTLTVFSVLRSPIFGFSDDMLLRLSYILRTKTEMNLTQLLRELEKEAGKSESWLIERTINIFQRVLPLDGVENAKMLIKELLLRTGYEEILISLPQGEKKLRNLEKLVRIVEEFENKGKYSARELPSYIEILKESSGMDAEAFLDNEDSDAVKILTIHASKGLEFPAVIIPDMDRNIDGMAKRIKPLLYVNAEAGITAIGINENLETDKDANPLYSQIYNEKLLRELVGSRRVLYVAATRAEKFLAFVGEEQEIKEEELDSQNSFMKQLKWAMGKAGDIEEIIQVEGESLIKSKPVNSEYPPAFLNDNLKLINSELQEENEALPLMLQPCSRESEGILSISMLMKYRDCPRNYYYSYIARLLPAEELQGENKDYIDETEEGSLDAAGMGTLVHKILEDLNESNGQSMETNISEIAATCESELNSNDIALLKKLLDGFIKIEKKRTESERGIKVDSLKEFSFRVPIQGSLYLNGIIDRIDIFEKDGKLIAAIIDYKTNKLEDIRGAEEKAKYYEEQLLAYAWSLSQIPFYRGKRLKIDEITLYFLSIGESVSLELTNEKVEQVVKGLQDDAPWLLGNKAIGEYPCKQSEKCRWCDYKSFCNTQ